MKSLPTLTLPLIIFPIFALTGCATSKKIDANEVAVTAGQRSNLGAPIQAHKCSFMQANIGQSSAPMQEGVCIAYESAFVYKSVDINDSSNGKLVKFDYRDMRYVGLTDPAFLGVRQFLFANQNYVNSVIFRPDHGMWYDNQVAKNFLDIFLSKGVKELKGPQKIDPEVNTVDFFFFTPVVY